MSKSKDDIIKVIDGIPYYHYEYAGFLYEKLQEKDEDIKSLEQKIKDNIRFDENRFKELFEAREETERLNKKLENLEKLNNANYQSFIEVNNIINELEKDFERKIQSCTIEAETTTNDFYCRLHIATLKKWLNKIQELKGSDKK